MQTNKRTESLPNMEVPQLPVSMLQHMEQMGLLPVSHEDDGVNNIDIPNGVYIFTATFENGNTSNFNVVVSK